MTNESKTKSADHVLEPAPGIDIQLLPRERDLGGFFVRRFLPYAKLRKVGPFVFFDHMGPAEFPSGQGIDVRPHPHIGLATITYLYEGEIRHRDSLGVVQDIKPGEVNWMTAGSGIVHSERTSPALLKSGQRLNGLQVWVALPEHAEEIDPEFFHYAADEIPEIRLGQERLRLVAGSAFGETSPVKTYSPLFYIDAWVPKGATISPPSEYSERAIYVVSGELSYLDLTMTAANMFSVETDAEIELTATEDSQVVMFGGAPMSDRYMYWNFVSSSEERIEQAKQDWQAERFPPVPGEKDLIPLPK